MAFRQTSSTSTNWCSRRQPNTWPSSPAIFEEFLFLRASATAPMVTGSNLFTLAGPIPQIGGFPASVPLHYTTQASQLTMGDLLTRSMVVPSLTRAPHPSACTTMMQVRNSRVWQLQVFHLCRSTGRQIFWSHTSQPHLFTTRHSQHPLSLLYLLHTTTIIHHSHRPPYLPLNPCDWIFRCLQRMILFSRSRWLKGLNYHEIPAHQRMSIPVMHLSRDAAYCISWYKARFPLDNWEHFWKTLIQHFGASDTLNLTVSLSHIRQGGFVKDYATFFEGFRMVWWAIKGYLNQMITGWFTWWCYGHGSSVTSTCHWISLYLPDLKGSWIFLSKVLSLQCIMNVS